MKEKTKEFLPLIIPLLAILGARFQVPELLLAMDLVILSFVGLVFLGKVRNLTSITYCIGLGVLWQTTLLSDGLIGSTDIHQEYFYFNNALINGWDPGIPHGYNSSIGLTLLGPFLSRFLGVDAYWVFKFIFPAIAALTPVFLFLAFKEFLSERKAFLSVFIFIAFPAFMIEVPTIAKLQLGLVPFSGLLLLAVKSFNWRVRLSLVFLLGILVCLTYYTLGFILFAFLVGGLFVLIALWLLRKWIKTRSTIPLKGYLCTGVVIIALGCTYFGAVGGGSLLFTLEYYARENLLNFNPSQGERAVDLEVTRRLAVEEVGRYGVVPGLNMTAEEASVITDTEYIKKLERLEEEAKEQIWTQVGLSLLDRLPGNDPPEGVYRNYLLRAALGLDFGQINNLGRIFRILQILTELLIIVGGIAVLRKTKEYPNGYLIWLVVTGVLLLLVLLKPGFSNLVDPPKLYQITLIFLSPLIVIGGCSILNLLKKKEAYLLLLIIPYYLFCSGFMFEYTSQPSIEKLNIPYNIGKSSYRVDISGTFTNNDIKVSNWLRDSIPEGMYLFSDLSTLGLTYEWDPSYQYSGTRVYHFPQNWIPQSLELIPGKSWIFLSERNEGKKEITYWVNTGLRKSYSYEERGMGTLLEGREIIYQAGNSVVYGERK